MKFKNYNNPDTHTLTPFFIVWAALWMAINLVISESNSGTLFSLTFSYFVWVLNLV